MKKTIKKRAFISAIAMLIVSAIVLTSSTFAWFSMSKATEVESMNLNITTADGISISANVHKFGTSVTQDDIIPSAETAENIYVVNKERYATGIYAAQTDFSDYFFQFNEVAAGEFAPLYNFDFGEVFAVDQFTGLTDSDKGSYVAVGADGKWVVASVASKYKFTGLYNDNGHSLARIEVCDTAHTPVAG